jgi:F-type H+-transporting ATPase subunit gamma
MPGRNELRQKIVSIKNTQKITRAMEMVAAGKMRKTQERLRQTRPYRERMALIIGHLARANHEYRHPFLIERPVNSVGMIVAGSDRGLCGGLNANLFRTILKKRQEWDAGQVPCDFGVIGRKAAGFFLDIDARMSFQVQDIGDTVHPDHLTGIIGGMVQSYLSGSIDRLHLAYNHFGSTLSQVPTIIQLLPVKTSDLVHDELLSERPFTWDYLYEPDPASILDTLLIRYVEALVFQGVVENQACEQAARMVAMKNASDNAGELIKELQLYYNKARQTAITREIAEIVAGSSAV